MRFLFLFVRKLGTIAWARGYELPCHRVRTTAPEHSSRESPLNSADLPTGLSCFEVLPQGQDDHGRCKRSDEHRNRQNEHDHLPWLGRAAPTLHMGDHACGVTTVP